MANLRSSLNRLIPLVALAVFGCARPDVVDKRSDVTAEESLDLVGNKGPQSQAGQVIDLRPRQCAKPDNCKAGFLRGACAANPVIPGSTGKYNSGLCQVSPDGKTVTTICQVEDRCCSNKAEAPGYLGCDFKPAQPNNACDKRACAAGRLVHEFRTKDACVRLTQTGECSWVWRRPHWFSECDVDATTHPLSADCGRGGLNQEHP